MRRRQALTLREAFGLDSYRRMRQAMQEGQGAATSAGMFLASAGDDEGQGEWHRWRGVLTQHYRLDGLLPAGSEDGGARFSFSPRRRRRAPRRISLLH